MRRAGAEKCAPTASAFPFEACMFKALPWRAASILTAALLAPVAAAAQQDDGFTVTRGDDTVAVERFTEDSFLLSGRLVRAARSEARERVGYRVTIVEGGATPLLELSAWRAEDPEESPARQTTRVIFKDDSVAVDEANRWSGVRTVVLPTAQGAVPYLNLSTAFLELATRRAARNGGRTEVPFFNLGGGQTVTGTVERLGSDSASVRIGNVEFRFRVDDEGRILGGAVPAQGLLITRESTH